MIEDRAGTYWFGTSFGGVSHFDGTNWRTFTTADGLAQDNVTAILEDRSGDLWFGTYESGVSRYDGVNWQTYTMADGLASNDVTAILEDKDANLWFGTWNSVSCYNGVRWRTYSSVDGLTNNAVTSVLEDHSGNLWFGTVAGVSRYDRVSWRTFTTADGLAGPWVRALLEDRAGALWFGTPWGVSRYDGVNWRTFTTADGLAHDNVTAILEDRSGNLWFGTSGGVSRYDGVNWRTFTTADGLGSYFVTSLLEDRDGNLWLGTGAGATRYDGVTFTTVGGLGSDEVEAILEDHSGALWFGTASHGVTRFDGVSWRTYTAADGLAGGGAGEICEDRSGALWFGTWSSGVSRFDGVTWKTYTTEDGLASNRVTAILEDRDGNLWLGTGAGATRYNGVTWRSFTTADGLAFNEVEAILEDRSGNLWFGAAAVGVTCHEPDRIPPRAVFLSNPSSPTTARNLSATFVAAFGEIRGIEFSYRFDTESWAPWSPAGAWTGLGVPDGLHSLEVRCRDYVGNIDSVPAKAVFEVDATPPAPVLASPSFGQPVRDSVTILGTAADARFRDYRLESRRLGETAWTSLATSSAPVSGGVLGGWNTRPLADDTHELRLSVTDTLGLTGSVSVEVVVDNQAPWAAETTPALVTAATGGHVYTASGRAHLYFPPHAFRQDARVTIAALDTTGSSAPPAGSVLAGYSIAWGGVPLEKAATLEFAVTESLASSARPVLYVSPPGQEWQRLGGTWNGSSRTIVAPIREPGRYAVITGEGGMPGEGSLSRLTLTPRAFSPRGTFAASHVAIGFSLGRAGAVTVRVYNRAGRLVRTVAEGESMGAGANLVRWDGRDREGAIVEDGLYLVAVESLGEKQMQTLAVVR
jgi:ligand-binding sensor domain-containing protein